MPTAYSYMRFSSEKQGLGDSIRRQKDLASKFIENNKHLGLVLDTTLKLTDEGLSAYKGVAQTKGSLGVFLRLVEDGKIEAGSYLLVESLDRLSRQTPRKALTQLNTLVDEGIVLVTLNDNKTYTKETLDENNGLNLLFAIMLMARAHEESTVKSQRISSAWQQKMLKIAEGVQLTKKVPFWINPEDRRKTRSEGVKTVREIFRLASEGFGSLRIAQQLNLKDTPTPSKRSTKWALSSVKKVLLSEAVRGVLTTANGERHEDYYPRIITESLWTKTRFTGSSSSRTRDSKNVHPLSGLCFCAKCGATAMRSGKTGRIRKDGTKNHWITLVCSKSLNKASDCTYRSISYNLLLESARDTIFASQYVEPANDIDKEIHNLEFSLDAYSDMYQDLKEQLLTERNNQTLRSEILKLTTQIDEMRKKLMKLKGLERPLTGKIVEEARLAIWNEKSYTNHNFRIAFKRIDIDFDNRTLTSTFHDSKIVSTEIMTIKEIVNSAI